MQSRRRRIDVLVVFRAWLLEAMQRTAHVVLREAGIGLSFFRQLDHVMFRRSDSQLLVEKSDLVEMRHGQLGLLCLGHLNESAVLFVEQDLHSDHVPVNTCVEIK